MKRGDFMSNSQKDYIAKYNKLHYIEKKIRLKPDLAQEIEQFLNWHPMSFNEFMVKSIIHYLSNENNVK